MLATLTLALGLIVQTPAAPAQQAPASPAPAPEAAASWVPQTICPVSQEELDDDKKHFVDYEGQRMYVCCKKCVKKAAASPEIMLARLAAAGQAPASIHKLCPVSGEELEDREHLIWVGNKSFAVCCKKCFRKASGTPAVYLDKLEGRTKQELCPISGKKIDRRKFVEVNGFRIHGCSDASLAKIEADPAAAFAKLASQRVVLEPLAKTCHLNPKEKRDVKVFVTMGAKRHYFCCAKCKGKWLAKQAAPQASQEAASGALDFLGGSLGGDGR